MTKRVLGFVMARNEWPLLGAAITHAISLGVDHIGVLDHQSTDETAKGLSDFQTSFPERLTVYRCNVDNFYQQNATLLTLEHLEAVEYDWIYVFDADEFLLISPGMALSDVLDQIPEQVDVVRYDVQQWIAPHDLNEQDPADFGRVDARAIPSMSPGLSSEYLAHNIGTGDLNYFDVCFPSKVILRGRLSQVLAPGAHYAIGIQTENEMKIEQSILQCAHLPLRSREHLSRKASQGNALKASGFPFNHGWQSQMISQLERSNELDEFWLRHSISRTRPGHESSCASTPTFEIDTAFSDALQSAFTLLQETKSAEGANPPRSSAGANHGVRDLEWSAVLRVLNRTTRDRDEAFALRDEAFALRDEAFALRDEAFALRDESITRIEALVNSKTWRWTAILRRLISWPLREREIEIEIDIDIDTDHTGGTSSLASRT